MEQRYAVEIENLVKSYPMRHAGRSKADDCYRALDGITINFPEGKRIGMVGMNGSGKSTLSNIIAGITEATSGQIRVNGTVSMLNTRIGLNPHLSGRESIHYKCLLLGFSDRDIAVMEDEIIDFADIGRFIDQPVRTYSSGMKARLGFAISSQLNTDILIVDEALAVGDDSFASKCEDWMQDYCQAGHTVLFVSHSLATMRNFCQEILWLHQGHQIGYGEAGMMLDAYANYSKAFRSMVRDDRNRIPLLEEWLPDGLNAGRGK